jgi:Chaperone of endosialidase
MGLSSKKTTTKTNETLAPSTYSQPYIDSAVSNLKPGLDQSQELVNRYLPQAQKGISYFGDVMSGKYLGEDNPFRDKVLAQMNEDTASAVNSQFSGASRYGSDYHADALARRIGQNEQNVRYADYATERGYQSQAPVQQQALIESTIGLPMRPGTSYADAINALVGKYATSTGTNVSKSSPSLLSVLAQAAQAGASIASDIRLKTNIEKVGEVDGLGVYDFDYLPIEGQIADYMPAGRQRGVIAQEVALLRPDALGPVVDGYLTVNYGAL